MADVPDIAGEQPCGPFAGIELSGHGSSCHTH